ncbi:hypothetical protein RYX36_035081, partial [Vicia faba]
LTGFYNADRSISHWGSLTFLCLELTRFYDADGSRSHLALRLLYVYNLPVSMTAIGFSMRLSDEFCAHPGLNFSGSGRTIRKGIHCNIPRLAKSRLSITTNISE